MAEFDRASVIALGKTSGGSYVPIQVDSSGKPIITGAKFKGYYATEAALTTAYPTATAGDYATVGATDTIWIWDADTSAWVDSSISGSAKNEWHFLPPINGNGFAITTGIKGDWIVPYNANISQYMILADQSGSISIDLWKDTYANYPPTDADSITASAPVAITAATKGTDSTLTGWTKAVTAGDVIRINVDSCATITRVSLALYLSRT